MQTQFDPNGSDTLFEMAQMIQEQLQQQEQQRDQTKERKQEQANPEMKQVDDPQMREQ